LSFSLGFKYQQRLGMAGVPVFEGELGKKR
jgi:hypothetical protein